MIDPSQHTHVIPQPLVSGSEARLDTLSVVTCSLSSWMPLSRAHGLIASSVFFPGLDTLRLTLLQDLLDDLVFIRRAKLVLQRGLGCLVQLTLRAVLVCEHDLERVHHLRQRDGAITLPGFQIFGTFDEDDEVIGRAFVEDFGNGTVSTGHGDGRLEIDRVG